MTPVAAGFCLTVVGLAVGALVMFFSRTFRPHSEVQANATRQRLADEDLSLQYLDILSDVDALAQRGRCLCRVLTLNTRSRTVTLGLRDDTGCEVPVASLVIATGQPQPELDSLLPITHFGCEQDQLMEPQLDPDGACLGLESDRLAQQRLFPSQEEVRMAVLKHQNRRLFKPA